MLISLVLLAVLAADPTFDVQTLDGRTISGRLVALDGSQLKLETADGPQTFELATLASATRAGAASAVPAKPAVLVELADGSQLPAAEYSVAGGKATIKLASGAAIDVDARRLGWVRFAHAGDADDKFDRQWSELTQAKAAGDVLVVRKQGALDDVEGKLGDVGPEAVQFEVDEEQVSVKRGKVEGMIYFHPPAADAAEPSGSVATTDGTRLAMRTARLEAAVLTVKTPGGVELPIQLDAISRLDYSTGKVAYLSDLDPQSASYEPLVGAKEELPALVEYYRYRRDQGFDGKPLVTGGKAYRKGLALSSRTTLAYRLPGSFRVFKATVGIDDAVRPLGSVRLVIQGDGKILSQQEIRGSEAAQELEVELGGVKRLEITADFGEEMDVADRLDLCEARVSK